jgi:hypothetical protein
VVKSTRADGGKDPLIAWLRGCVRPHSTMEAMMGDTYDSAAEAEADRAQQKDLLTALNAWDRALRRDECGAWCIHGNKA